MYIAKHQEMMFSGFKTSNEGVFVVAATNHKDQIDSALLRRFSRHIFVPIPEDKPVVYVGCS